MKSKVLAETSSEFRDSLDGDLGGVVKVIHDDDVEPFAEELQHGVAPDVAGTAGDQHAPRHGRARTQRGGRTAVEERPEEVI